MEDKSSMEICICFPRKNELIKVLKIVCTALKKRDDHFDRNIDSTKKLLSPEDKLLEKYRNILSIVSMIAHGRHHQERGFELLEISKVVIKLRRWKRFWDFFKVFRICCQLEIHQIYESLCCIWDASINIIKIRLYHLNSCLCNVENFFSGNIFLLFITEILTSQFFFIFSCDKARQANFPQNQISNLSKLIQKYRNLNKFG